MNEERYGVINVLTGKPVFFPNNFSEKKAKQMMENYINTEITERYLAEKAEGKTSWNFQTWRDRHGMEIEDEFAIAKVTEIPGIESSSKNRSVE